MGVVSRGEIWLVRLDPTVGSEIQKTRPCLVVSPQSQQRLHTAIIAPMTSKGFEAPYRPTIIFQGVGGKILTDQLRAVSHRRFVKKVGEVDASTLTLTLSILRETFED